MLSRVKHVTTARLQDPISPWLGSMATQNLSSYVFLFQAPILLGFHPPSSRQCTILSSGISSWLRVTVRRCRPRSASSRRLNPGWRTANSAPSRSQPAFDTDFQAADGLEKRRSLRTACPSRGPGGASPPWEEIHSWFDPLF